MENRKISIDIIKQIVKEAFEIETNNIAVKRLSGGYKNKVYLLTVKETKYVLKIGLDDNMLMPIDKNKLAWEYSVLKELESYNLNTPKAFFYKDKIGDYNYPVLLMEYISGNNFKDCKDNLSKEQINSIYYILGKISSRQRDIKKEYYYIPGFEKEKYTENYDMVYDMFKSILFYYKKYRIDIEGIKESDIIKIIKNNKIALNKVKNICLCNTDLWDGNVIVKNANIVGLVDFGDTFYADELMSYLFHETYEGTNEYFRLGYCNIKLDKYDLKRIKIYRLYSILKTIIDCEIKHYGRYGKLYVEFINIYKDLLIC